MRNGERRAHWRPNDASARTTLTPLEITMRTIRCPASTWRANIRSAVNLAGQRRSALLVTVNLAAAAIYLVRLGHGIGLGGYRIDLDVYRTGATGCCTAAICTAGCPGSATATSCRSPTRRSQR